jgi:hypothetical protein
MGKGGTKMTVLNTRPCDKCGEPVDEANNAVALDEKISGGSMALIFARPRHLLPTEHCAGSPSRAQYLPGQPEDPRYPYQDEYEVIVRTAYACMLLDEIQRERKVK